MAQPIQFYNIAYQPAAGPTLQRAIAGITQATPQPFYQVTTTTTILATKKAIYTVLAPHKNRRTFLKAQLQ